MGAWLSNISLKYKFWAVNAVAFVTTLLPVLYAVYPEQQARAEGARNQAIAQAELIAAWPEGQPLPQPSQAVMWQSGQTPVIANQPREALVDAQGWVALPNAWVLGNNPCRAPK